ncbi:Non-ribosomal peptide synthetase [Marinobacterium lacunae]|uniref:Non-ribosomal peptide synthetase n=1 Tax=Marinobacterium lacunae TaxID=1232683 RepID=A0A081FVF9_9GAMM|nr:non-ribosomal peptide synthetase [Marinobacterium lacunae]KEA62514.1 Non-ribosomal peptide synthetase [Marinobacterium lacunae]
MNVASSTPNERQSQRLEQVARRFRALPADKQQLFLQRLDEQGIAFHQLPVVPDPARGTDTNARREHPATPGQLQLWLGWRLAPEADPYTVHGVLNLRGALDADALRRSVALLVSRHEALRTHFIHSDSRGLLQVIAPASECDHCRLVDVSSEHQAREHVRHTLHTPFDLERGPLVRFTLYRFDDRHHWLELCLHHSISDGWTLRLLNRELGTLYQALTDRPSADAPLEPLALQFADLAHWQQAYLDAGGRAMQRAFWHSLRLHQSTPMPLPTDRMPAQGSTARKSSACTRTLSPELSNAIRRASLDGASTTFRVMLTALMALLYHYTRQQRLTVAIPNANRHWPGSEQVAGYCVNLLPICVDADPDQPLARWLNQVGAMLDAVQQHQDLTLEEMLGRTEQQAGADPDALLQVVFNYQEAREALALGGVDVEALADLSRPSAKFPLAWGVESARDGTLQLSILYDANLFSPQRIERLIDDWSLILQRFAADSRQSVRASLFNHPRPASASGAGASEAAARSGLTPWQQIADWAKRTPHVKALIGDRDSLSFSELDGQANTLAERLRQAGIGRDDRIAVCLERGAGLFITLLGILKAGAAYVPLDPDYPPSRLRFMLKDSGAKRLITASGLLPLLTESEPVTVDTWIYETMPASQSPAGLPDTHPDQLAYLIYTSGSTGTPKAVAVSVGAISRHLAAIAEYYAFAPDDRLLHQISICFDGAIEAWLGALSQGVGIHVTPQQPLGAEALIERIKRDRITRLGMPPSYLLQIVEQLEQHPQRLALRSVTLGGEAVTLPVYQRIRAAFPGVRLHNGYGPTETVITPMLWSSDDAPLPADDSAPYLPIGRAIGQRRLHVLDRQMAPVPVGVPGELYIGGPELARGYLGRPGLTAQRFVADPFGPPGARLYRTGDRVRWREDGGVDYLGRLDHQVKLRGLRIELGEIEARLLTMPAVAEAVVRIEGEAPDQHLAAHLSPTEGLRFEDSDATGNSDWIERIKAQLSRQLPAYMLPSRWAAYARLPRLPNGKLDYAALPSLAASAGRGTPPQGDVEQRLAALWQHILDDRSPSREDRFDQLGGHSLRLLKLQHAIQEQFNLSVSLQALVSAPTLSEQAALLTRQRQATDGIPRQQNNSDNLVPLSLGQRRQWFSHRDPGACDNQISWHVQLTGELDVAALERALGQLTRRHDAMRLAFRPNCQGDIVQYDSGIDSLPLSRIDLRPLPPAERVEQAHALTQTFLDTDIAPDTAPLWRITLIQLEDNAFWMLGAVSHLVIDGAGLMLWMHELSVLYNAHLSDEDGGGIRSLHPLGSRYLDHIVDELERAQTKGADWQAAVAFWRAELLQPLRLDWGQTPPVDRTAFRCRQTLPDELSARVFALHTRQGIDVEALTLGAYLLLLAQCDQLVDDQIMIKMPHAGRRSEAGVIGLYADLITLPFQLQCNDATERWLARIHRQLTRAKAHAHLPWLGVCEALAIDPEHPAFARAGFNFIWRPAPSLVGFQAVKIEPLTFERHRTDVDYGLVLNLCRETSQIESCWTLACERDAQPDAEIRARQADRMYRALLEQLCQAVESKDPRLLADLLQSRVEA